MNKYGGALKILALAAAAGVDLDSLPWPRGPARHGFHARSEEEHAQRQAKAEAKRQRRAQRNREAA